MKRYRIATAAMPEGMVIEQAPGTRGLAMVGYTVIASVALALAGSALAWLFDAPPEGYRLVLALAVLPIVALALAALTLAGLLVVGAAREALESELGRGEQIGFMEE